MTTFLLKCLGTGLVTGTVSGLTGMGGGAIFVPVFFFLFGLPIKTAIGTSLLVIVFSSAAALLTHLKGQQVHLRLAAVIIISGVLGAQIGACITGIISDIAVKVLFVVIVAASGAKMWLKQDSKAAGARRPGFNLVKAVLIGLAGGVISGLGGVGGAIVIIPLLHCVMDLPMSRCIGTALAAVFFNALSGCAGYLVRQEVALPIGLTVSMGAVIAAPLGAWLSMKTEQNTLRRIFAVILIITGASLLLKL